MGLFGKLFDKKICDICGGEIGLLGNRKLEDGNLCKNCAKKLSPWFDDRRHSTVDQIREQLEYREANKEKVAAFNVTRSFGDCTKVLLDEDAGVFMVSTGKNLKEENPDVLAFSDVTGCRLDIDEDRTEITREGKDGERISYNPPRYTYRYDFYVEINVRNPYFDDIRFKLNRSSIEIDSQNQMAGQMRRPGMPGGSFSSLVGGGARGVDPTRNIEYNEYKQMGEEIREALLRVRQDARDNAAAAAAPKAAVVCPYCGATTTPDASGCCEYCGAAVNG